MAVRLADKIIEAETLTREFAKGNNPKFPDYERIEYQTTSKIHIFKCKSCGQYFPRKTISQSFIQQAKKCGACQRADYLKLHPRARYWEWKKVKSEGLKVIHRLSELTPIDFT